MLSLSNKLRQILFFAVNIGIASIAFAANNVPSIQNVYQDALARQQTSLMQLMAIAAPLSQFNVTNALGLGENIDDVTRQRYLCYEFSLVAAHLQTLQKIKAQWKTS